MKNSPSVIVAWLCLFVAIDAINLSDVFAHQPALTKVRPEELGMDSERLACVDNVVEEGLQPGSFCALTTVLRSLLWDSPGVFEYTILVESVEHIRLQGFRRAKPQCPTRDLFRIHGHGTDRQTSCLWQEN